MANYMIIYCFTILVLNQIGINFALPIEFDNGQQFVRQLRIAQKCSGQKLGLYVPYNTVKFFWSGFGVADSDKVAAEIAQHIAGKEGKKGVTLEMLLEMKENAHIKPCKWTTPVTPECQKFWQDLSCEYATASRGEIRSIIGPNLNPNSAWLTIEKNQIEYHRSNGQDVWGFKQYELENVYCKDMATHNSQVPHIKNEICTRNG